MSNSRTQSRLLGSRWRGVGGSGEGDGPDGPFPPPHPSRSLPPVAHTRAGDAGGHAFPERLDRRSSPPGPSDIRPILPICSRGRWIGLQHVDTGERRWVPCACSKLSCPDCGPRAQNRYIAQFLAGKPTRTFVLTTPSLGDLPVDVLVHVFRKRFTRLMRLATKEFGPLHWICSLEPHKSGQVHMHGAYRGAYIPQRWLAQTWGKITGSKHVWIHAIKSLPYEARHLAKYLTKSAAWLSRLGSKRKVITHSRHFLPPDFKEANSNEAQWKVICTCRIPPERFVQLHDLCNLELLLAPEHQRGFVARPRGPPPEDVFARLEREGDRGERFFAAWAREIHLLAGAPPVSADELRDRIDLATDPREPI